MGHSPELCDLALEVALMGSGTSKGFLTSILQQQIRAEPRGWEDRHKTPSTKLQRFDFDSFSSPLQEGGQPQPEKAKLRMEIRAVLKIIGIKCPLPAPTGRGRSSNVLGKRSPLEALLLGKGLAVGALLWQPSPVPSRSGMGRVCGRQGRAMPLHEDKGKKNPRWQQAKLN